MAISEETENATTGAEQPSGRKTERSLVLVAGSGRSGTSLFSGILQRLGYQVPQPEVPADATNPRGFAESQWVVDFHTRLLAKAAVQVSDARPAAWAYTADVALDEGAHEELGSWLGKQFRSSEHVLVKDPRLSWFLPLWRRCAEEAGVSPRFATVLRHPAAVIDSKQRSYGHWQSDVSRTAGWLNQTLFTERATRESPRVFVRYEDLLDDWTRAIGHAGEQLGLAVVRDATPAAMRRAHEFVDKGLSRSPASWQGFTIPPSLQEQADELWELAQQLASGENAALHAGFDTLRAAYGELYAEAEAIAQSSVAAAKAARPAGARPQPPTAARALAARVPDPVRRRIPTAMKVGVYRRLSA